MEECVTPSNLYLQPTMYYTYLDPVLLGLLFPFISDEEIFIHLEFHQI